jgi:hypothetical protein
LKPVPLPLEVVFVVVGGMQVLQVKVEVVVEPLVVVDADGLLDANVTV